MKNTSKQANKEKEGDYRLILSCLNNTPITYKEIFKIAFYNKYGHIQDMNVDVAFKIASRFNPNVISRRTSELVRMGKVQECESRICTIAKRKCTTYIAL